MGAALGSRRAVSVDGFETQRRGTRLGLGLGSWHTLGIVRGMQGGRLPRTSRIHQYVTCCPTNLISYRVQKSNPNSKPKVKTELETKQTQRKSFCEEADFHAAGQAHNVWP